MSMMSAQVQAETPGGVLGLIRLWFLRVMAVICLVSALVYWAQLLGITGDGSLRFDLVEPRWRAVSTALAVVLPAAALGLWMAARWGIVLWIITQLAEIAIYGVWSHMFAEKPALVVGHLSALGFLAVLTAVIFWRRRRAAISPR